ncbi:MAG: hypothetical protein LIO92_00340 [Clostridiales bacterium]|nr:hypothetical protein [Clostridiales bacterium]
MEKRRDLLTKDKLPLPIEDRTLKDAMQLFAKELLPRLGIEEKVVGVAPSEAVHLEMRDLLQDFMFVMDNGQWRHMEFESDRLVREDLVRFRAAEALTSHIYGVDVVTSVLCTANVKSPLSELRTGINTYKVSIINMQLSNADERIRRVEKIQETTNVGRMDLVELLLTPLMSGELSIKERIRRTLLVLQKERDNLDETDYRRMGSILFAFAVKFLEKEEVSDLKEAFSMTVLGQMIYKDGIEKGIEQRDKMLIFKWSADGRKPAEIAALLGISEEEVKKVQTEKMMSI